MNNKFAGLLGILNRGGKLLIGAAIPPKVYGLACLITAKDASVNTLEKYVTKATYYCIPVLEVETKKELGDAIGFEEISVIGIKDKKAAQALINLWKGEHHEG